VKDSPLPGTPGDPPVDGSRERCPDPADLAAYIDGTAGEAERRVIEEHLSRCDDCYRTFVEAKRTLIEMDAAMPVRTRQFPVWIAAAAVVVMTVAGTWTWRRATRPAISLLVEAVGSRRLIEPRLAGGFRAGPLAGPMRGSIPEARDVDLLAAAGRVRERAERDPRPENRRAHAAAQLLVGNVEAGAEQLEAIVRDDPADARNHNDLAAAYLLRAERAGRAEDLPRALESADRALEISPGMPEALFNRALALERLNLRGEARKAWEACRDQGGVWGEVAAERLRRLDQDRGAGFEGIGARIDAALDARDEAATRGGVAASVEAARVHFEQVLLPAAVDGEWAPRDRLSSFAASFEDVTGDSGPRAVAQDLEARGDAETVRSAYRRYLKARRHYVLTQWSAAEPLFARAATDPAFVASSLQPWAELHAAILDFQDGRTLQATNRLEALRKRLSRLGQPLLRARVEWMLGLLAVNAGRFDDALRHHGEGADLFAAARDHAHASYMAFQSGEVLAFLGRPALGWRRRVEALRRRREFPDPARRINLLFASGDHCTEAGLPRAAAYFAREARAVAEAEGTEADRIQSALTYALATCRTHPSESGAALADAEGRLSRVTDGALRQRLQGEAYRVTADVSLAKGDDRGAGALDRAIEWLEAREAWARVAPLYLQRGLLNADRGDVVAARRDLDRVLALTRGMSTSALDLRVSHARLALSAYNRLLDLEGQSGADGRDTLATAEQRWQAADGSFSSPEAAKAAVTAVVDGLAEDTAVVGFVPTADGLASWSVRRGRVLAARSAIPAAELESLVDRVVAHARRSETEEDVALIDLRRTLLGPHAETLASARQVFAVTAGPLRRLPFALLRGDGGLAASTVIASVPSLHLLSEKPAGPRKHAPRLAVLGFASGAGDLPALRRVEEEIRTIASNDAEASVAAGAEATKEAFGRLAARATVIHFAGHAIVNDERPLYSSLVVAGHRGADDHLTAQEIARLDLRHVELVTLSTCSAAATSGAYGDAALSIARAFLAAGAHSVVAPLWDVSDADMPELMGRLHRAWREGKDPAEAAAQVLRWAETQQGGSRFDARSLVVLTGQGALSRSQRQPQRRTHVRGPGQFLRADPDPSRRAARRPIQRRGAPPLRVPRHAEGKAQASAARGAARVSAGLPGPREGGSPEDSDPYESGRDAPPGDRSRAR
jgi:tetratricopeptide (TPR) repeat protein